MKSFDKIFAAVIIAIAALFAGANLLLMSGDNNRSGREYRVEISRLAAEIVDVGYEKTDLSDCTYVTGIYEYSADFYNTNSDYVIREIHGSLYRFEYNVVQKSGSIVLHVNIILAAAAVFVICLMMYIRQRILKPFDRLSQLPYELSKGNLTVPIKENKNRFFGKFLWGVDLLRENIEEQKERELSLQRDKKTLLLSLSHDIKTPLSAIKLYSKALTRGLYSDSEKQMKIADNINAKADEIEHYLSDIITAAREDFLSFDVTLGEFYLGTLLEEIGVYYSEKLNLIKTDFKIGEYNNCLIKGDYDRSVEVIQNVMENAIKYGDGREIFIGVSEEEGCVLVTVKNSGNALSEKELTNIFESFVRGGNVGNIKGSGLGLYICKQLMSRMNGEIYAEIKGCEFCVTAVFAKA